MDALVELTVPLPDILEEVDGEYKVKGHRITLYHIVTAFNERWIGPHSMVFHYPTLSLYEIEKVLEFYRANQEAVLDYVRRYKAVLEEQYQAGNKIDLEELRRRFEAKLAATRVSAEANGHPVPRQTDKPTASHKP